MEDHEILEQFDRFCALMVRVKAFSNIKLKDSEKELWGKLLEGDFWISRINQREEMKLYVKNHWNELNSL